MSQDERRAALERYVAGLQVDDDTLAHAVAESAVERAVVVEAILKGLNAPDPGVRRRIARRTRRMRQLDPAVGARLAVLVDQDADLRVRSACAEALHAHGLPVPGEPQRPEAERAPRAARVPWRLPVLALRAYVVNSDDAPPLSFEPLFASAQAGDGLEGDLHDDGPAGVRVELRGLPSAYAGVQPVLRAVREAGGPLVSLARAEAPVSDGGMATFRIPLSDGTPDDVRGWCLLGVDLVVPADG